ncbi:hypothetical protein ALC57_09101 [Trachymyrmex cornetzi]|uniref:Peptidase C19 ubiquitin carboxyl-terminal hydrolase domain-containing protein n=1 Tax=Trachymyrmex cornetzi TaxID=471704 RepID=A0A151J5S9_9HYME|nr:hypothetical protein ALC57_09101 [Trachymyrmex cornetzi]
MYSCKPKKLPNWQLPNWHYGMDMHNNYKTAIETLHQTNAFIKLITEILKRGKIVASDYCARATILYDISIFSKEYLFQNMPSCTTAYECVECGHNYRKTSPTCNINIDEILRNGLQNIQKAIDNDIITKRVTIILWYGPHLIFDTNILTDISYIYSLGMQPPQYILDNVAKTIIADGHKYYLVGIVSYIKYSDDYADGHYIAYTYTGSEWYKYDDMASKRSCNNESRGMSPRNILY